LSKKIPLSTPRRGEGEGVNGELNEVLAQEVVKLLKGFPHIGDIAFGLLHGVPKTHYVVVVGRCVNIQVLVDAVCRPQRPELVATAFHAQETFLHKTLQKLKFLSTVLLIDRHFLMLLSKKTLNFSLLSWTVRYYAGYKKNIKKYFRIWY